MKALLALLILLAAGAPPAKSAEPLSASDLGAIAAAAVEDHIRPGFDALAVETAVLADRMRGLCSTPSPDTLAAARAGFAAVVRGWSAVEFLRLGPMTEAHRADRFYFWPDRKGITLRHVQAALAAEDPALTTPAGMAEASVAVQGLPALEFLLHGSGAEALAAPPAGYRCTFAATVADNIAAIAADAAAGWRDPEGFSAVLLRPGPDNALFRTAEEAAARVTDIPGTAAHMLQDRKLNPAIGTDPGSARPNLAPFRRSGLTNAALRANLEGLKLLADRSGMSAAVRDRAPALQSGIDTVYGNLFSALAELPVPLGEAAADPQLRGLVNHIALLLSRLRTLLQEQAPAALGMKVMFNAYDGD